jgi:hypothetical protein
MFVSNQLELLRIKTFLVMVKAHSSDIFGAKKFNV